MTKRRLRNCGRPKALFGEEGAAILTAAGISAAATAAGAALSAKASKDAAKKQADATIQQANRQAEALKQQSDAQNEAVTKQQEFVKEQYAQNREIAKDTQLLLQQQMGLENSNDRLEASKIKVKRGGRASQRLRNVPTIPLRGGSNLPFKVTDGGSVNFVGSTPEGYGLYELRGNDHEHYHKSQGGKNKTGVGIKFYYNNGLTSTIEGEGNQHSNQGEYMLDMPDDALFISKHSINGFNPADAVNRGMHPLVAYQLQEKAKGKKTRPVGRMIVGGDVLTNILNGESNPDVDFSTDNMATTVAEFGYLNQQPKEFKRGGRLRCMYGGRPKMKLAGSLSGNTWTVGKGDTLWGLAARYGGGGKNYKALLSVNPGIKNANLIRPGQKITLPSEWGFSSPSVASSVAPAVASGIVANNPALDVNNYTFTGSQLGIDTPEITRSGGTSVGGGSVTGGTTPAAAPKKGGFWNSAVGAQTIAAGIGAAGNIIGGLISTSGNNRAAEIMADAQQRGADIMSEAYRNLKGIDPSIVSASNYRAAHYMPAVHTARVNVNPQIEDINRSVRRTLRNMDKNGISSAAKQKRMMDMFDLATQRKSEVYARQTNAEEENRARTAQQISEAAAQNAQLDMQAMRDYTNAALEVAKYNSQIENSKILGAAGAQSDAAVKGADVLSQATSSNSGIWSNALTNSANSFANTLSTMAKRKSDLDNTMLGASTEAQVRYLGLNGSDEQKSAYIQKFRDAIDSGKLSPDDVRLYNRYIQWLSAKQ